MKPLIIAALLALSGCANLTPEQRWELTRMGYQSLMYRPNYGYYPAVQQQFIHPPVTCRVIGYGSAAQCQ